MADPRSNSASQACFQIALIAATRTGAECLDMADDIGTVEVDKYADLVLVDGDPLADVTILQDEARIAQVFKGGKAFK